MAVYWFDGSVETTGWLDDYPDIEEQTQLEQSLLGTESSTVTGRAGNQNAPSESTGDNNFARDQSISSIEDIE